MKHALAKITLAAALLGLPAGAWADKPQIEKKAQAKFVSLNVANTPVDEALRLISTLSGISIEASSLPENIPMVTFDIKNMPAIDAIRFVAKQADLKVEIRDDGFHVSGQRALPDKLLVGIQGKFSEGATRIELHSPVASYEVGIGDYICYVDLEKPVTQKQLDEFNAFSKKHPAGAKNGRIELIIEVLAEDPKNSSLVKGRVIGVGQFPVKPGRRKFEDVDLEKHLFQRFELEAPASNGKP